MMSSCRTWRVFCMKKVSIIIILVTSMVIVAKPTQAFSREDIVRDARAEGRIITIINVSSTIVHVGGSQVGNSAVNTNSFPTLQAAIERINQLRNQLRDL